MLYYLRSTIITYSNNYLLKISSLNKIYQKLHYKASKIKQSLYHKASGISPFKNECA